MSGPGIRRVSIRFNRREGWFEARCDGCVASGQSRAYWPLTVDAAGVPEFWDPRSGMQKCRACHNTARRRNRHQTPEERRKKQRAYYRQTRAERLATRHAYYAANRDAINAARRAAYAEKVAARRTPTIEDMAR